MLYALSVHLCIAFSFLGIQVPRLSHTRTDCQHIPKKKNIYFDYRLSIVIMFLFQVFLGYLRSI